MLIVKQLRCVNTMAWGSYMLDICIENVRYIRCLYFVNYNTADCRLTDHVIFTFNYNKNDVTDRLYHCNSLWLLIATSLNTNA